MLATTQGVSSATDIFRGMIRDQDEIDQHRGIIRDDTSQQQDADMIHIGMACSSLV
jgi:hypothetical protein